MLFIVSTEVHDVHRIIVIVRFSVICNSIHNTEVL